MSQAQAGPRADEPKLVLPFLQSFYDQAIPLSWLLIRVAAGWNLLVHGWGKIMAGPTAAFLKGYSDMGFNPPEPWFWCSTTVETTAGVALILGLFTRFFAAAEREAANLPSTMKTAWGWLGESVTAAMPI